jgi:hypothetical protein
MMTRSHRLRVVASYVKQYAAAVISALLMYVGIEKMILALSEPITEGILRSINAVIRTGFRDRLLLPEHGGIPWRFHAMVVATGIAAIVLGIFVGIWVNSREQRQPAR